MSNIPLPQINKNSTSSPIKNYQTTYTNPFHSTTKFDGLKSILALRNSAVIGLNCGRNIFKLNNIFMNIIGTRLEWPKKS